MANYVVCPGCGDHLDPGERCTTCREWELEAVRLEQLEEYHQEAQPKAAWQDVAESRVETLAPCY